MAAKEHKERKSGIPLRLATVFGALLFCSVSSRAEDLTTLDGKTYTNITDFAKYPSQVFFKFNENRIGIAISNLPPEFRSKHGLKEPEKKTIQQVNLPQTNSVDWILGQSKDSDLYVERAKEETIKQEKNYIESGKWTIRLTPIQINLKAENSSFSMPTNYYRYPTKEMSLSFGQEVLIQPVFDKFLEWESVAMTNKAEPFNKVISRWPGSIYTTDGMRHFTFYWHSGARLGDSDGGSFSSMDVGHLRQLLKLVPDLKEELVQKIRNKNAQQNLFK